MINKHEDENYVRISLFELSDRENYDPIDIMRIIDKNSVRQLTNVIEKSSFPQSIAYTMWKQFNETMQARLLAASLLIDDEKLKKDIIDYAGSLGEKIETVMTEEEFLEFAEDIEKNIKFLL